jgi:uncharacterized membrane protein HdeD (DUF308 family)
MATKYIKIGRKVESEKEFKRSKKEINTFCLLWIVGMLILSNIFQFLFTLNPESFSRNPVFLFTAAIIAFFPLWGIVRIINYYSSTNPVYEKEVKKRV